MTQGEHDKGCFDDHDHGARQHKHPKCHSHALPLERLRRYQTNHSRQCQRQASKWKDMVPPDPLRRAQIEKLTGKIDRDQGSQFFRLRNTAKTHFRRSRSRL
ncbi:hypothetical protein Lal_00046542 [Lupinus albus]|nr:hypothetical protein Lal_00046542 [Lupinus albus]